MKIRVSLILILLIVFIAVVFVNFLIKIYFTKPVERNLEAIGKETVEVNYPAFLASAFQSVDFHPPTSNDLPGCRFFIKPGRYIMNYLNNYYWISEDFVIVDFANSNEVMTIPLVSGVDFKLDESGEFHLSENNPEWVVEVVQRIYDDENVLKLISLIDFQNNVLYLKRGIRIQIFDWKDFSFYKDKIIEIYYDSEDMQKYLYKENGDMQRVR